MSSRIVTVIVLVLVSPMMMGCPPDGGGQEGQGEGSADGQGEGIGEGGSEGEGEGGPTGCAAPPQALPHPHGLPGDLLLLALLGAGLGAAGRRRQPRRA